MGEPEDYRCGICTQHITSKEIEHNLVFKVKHKCGRTVWYHACCALEVVDNL